ncbi:MAG: ferredoxin--NADP reductase [Candidatus Dormibacteraeota bacterium]|nr:ferredoxin--NADP reductase [Candidatus Dormibacteraeota bacterium]
MIDSDKYASATVMSRRDFAPDLWVIRIKPDIELPFRPGQYVTIGLPRNGRVIERPYSICSAPAEEEIELFIERVPEGELSDPLFGLGVGGEMVVRKRAKGLFLRDAPVVDQPHLLVATVTGIAPFVSFLRTLVARDRTGEWTPVPITVLQGASRSEELGYFEELRMLDADFPWLTYVPTVSRPWEDPEWPGETGRVEDVVRKYADALEIRPASGAVFLCGHPGMIANARGIMRRRGLADKDIREEQYWPD